MRREKGAATLHAKNQARRRPPALNAGTLTINAGTTAAAPGNNPAHCAVYAPHTHATAHSASSAHP